MIENVLQNDMIETDDICIEKNQCTTDPVAEVYPWLSKKLSEDSSTRPEDVKKTKEVLEEVGYDTKEKNEKTVHEYPTKKLFSTIRKFQKDQNLKSDGVMNPGGKTEERLVQRAREMHQKRFNNAVEKIPKEGTRHFENAMQKAKKQFAEIEDDIYPKNREVKEQKHKKAFTPLGSDIFKQNDKKSSRYNIVEDKDLKIEKEEVFVNQSKSESENNKEDKEYLLFDGKRLRWIKDGKTIQSWIAMSGQKEFQSKKYTGLKNKGPIPEGAWSVNQKKYQSYRNKNNLLTHVLNNLDPFRLTNWSGGKSSWGNHRIWIEAKKGTDSKRRSGFSIHGGDELESLGCLDLGAGMDSFIRRYKRYGKDIKLKVKYGKSF